MPTCQLASVVCIVDDDLMVRSPPTDTEPGPHGETEDVVPVVPGTAQLPPSHQVPGPQAAVLRAGVEDLTLQLHCLTPVLVT